MTNRAQRKREFDRRNAEAPRYRCLLCGRTCQCGAGVWEARAVWHGVICETCEAANWDGVGPLFESKVLAHLAEHGIEPTRNEKGWIVIPAKGAR